MGIKHVLWLVALGAALVIPTRLAIAYHQAPQAILVLGGGMEREVFGAAFAAQHPALPIWVSSGEPMAPALEAFRDAGVQVSRLRRDYRATDTVTNFTTLVDDLGSAGVRHLYLITSEYHMPRAQVVAALVLGSRGIAFSAVAVPSTADAPGKTPEKTPEKAPESPLRTIRDAGRSLLWLTTGRTGASLGRHIDRVNVPDS